MTNSFTQTGEKAFHKLFSPEEISANTIEVNDRLVKTLSTLTLPEGLDAMRDAYSRGDLGLPASPKSPRAYQITIPGPTGPLNLRILIPDEVRGVYLHFHGGGWMLGSNDTWDGLFELFGRDAGMISVSVNYRLAPEHVFPAAVEDCLATALWLIEHAQVEFGTSWLAIGGESAGANLAASTLLRLRDMGHVGAFSAANLLFGCYDLSLTPSLRLAQGTPFVDCETMTQYISAFAGDTELRDPKISPLYADLHNLPSALFTVGSIDPLLDDSLFMYMRWQAACNKSELSIYPGGIHGFNSLDSDIAHNANHGMAQFLHKCRNESI